MCLDMPFSGMVCMLDHNNIICSWWGRGQDTWDSSQIQVFLPPVPSERIMGLQMDFFLPTVPRGGTMGLQMDFLISFSSSSFTPPTCQATLGSTVTPYILKNIHVHSKKR